MRRAAPYDGAGVTERHDQARDMAEVIDLKETQVR